MTHNNPSEETAEDLLSELMNNTLAKKGTLVAAPPEHLVELLKAHWLHRISVELSLLNNTLDGIRTRL